MLAVVAMYAGIVLGLLGAVGLIWPRVLGASERTPALIVVWTGIVLVTIAVIWPAPDVRAARVANALDEFMPAWQFDVSHAIRIAAPPERVFQAIKLVTADEILLFRTLTFVRRFGAS